MLILWTPKNAFQTKVNRIRDHSKRVRRERATRYQEDQCYYGVIKARLCIKNKVKDVLLTMPKRALIDSL